MTFTFFFSLLSVTYWTHLSFTDATKTCNRNRRTAEKKCSKLSLVTSTTGRALYPFRLGKDEAVRNTTSPGFGVARIPCAPDIQATWTGIGCNGIKREELSTV